VRDHFKAEGVAIQKWPEELHRVPAGEDFPRTASGKVQKFRVREQIGENAITTQP
jgi:acyl-CoA synthetase